MLNEHGRWAMLCRNVSNNIVHSSSIRLKNIRAAKIKLSVELGIPIKDVETKPLTTWLIYHGIEQALEHDNKAVEIITNVKD